LSDYNTMDNLIDEVEQCEKPITPIGIIQNYLGIAVIEGIHNDATKFDSEKTANAVQKVYEEITEKNYTQDQITDMLREVRDSDDCPCDCENCIEQDPYSKQVYGEE